MLGLLFLTSCSSQHSPAPVTTLELRTQAYQERNRGTLSAASYVVQRGDTLYSIAFRAGLDVRTIAGFNQLASPYTIYPGQVIHLRAPATVARAKPVTTNKTPTKPTTAARGSAEVKNTPVKTVVKPKATVPQNSSKPVASANQKSYGQTDVAKQVQTTGTRVQWSWPVRGRIISGFSYQQNGNKGLDIAGSDGARVNAAADGQVVYAGNALRGYGNLIIIRHNEDYLSAYAHNKKILVTEKQQVKAGQQIAQMGSSDAVDTRLHFEIRFRGTSVDPLKYLPK